MLARLRIDYDYLWLVFFSTVWIYSIHRIVGIDKLKSENDSGRFAVISRYKNHIKLYTLFSTVGIVWSLTNQSFQTILLLIPVGLISCSYVIPFLKGGRRIRDYNYVKILLIGFVWAYISCLPVFQSEVVYGKSILIFIEKMTFVIAITIPFDIRDLRIDGKMNLLTIPKVIGLTKSYWISYGLLSLGLIMFITNWGGTTSNSMIGLLVYFMTGFFIMLSKHKSSDWYFSGLIDGSLLLRGLVIWSALQI